jgi:ribosomal RNA-processing protein 17
VVISLKLQSTSKYDIDNEEEEEWAGICAEEYERDEEYEDEEILATVTVVEDFDPDTIIHGPPKPDHLTLALPEPKPKLSRQLQFNTGEKKSRQRKIPYETSDARKKERTKQRARRTEKAELAGGKAARKSQSARGVIRRKASSKR